MGFTPPANPQPYSIVPYHTQSHKFNRQCNSPTQPPAQGTTTNHPIRLSHRLSLLALPLQPPQYTNQLYTSSSNEQAYPPTYPSVSTTSKNNIRPPHHAPEGSHHDWPASAWNKSNSIAAASKYVAYQARAAQPTPAPSAR